MFVAAKESAFARITARMSAAIPGSSTELVDGGHLIDPGEPAVLGFVRSVLAA